MKVIDSNTVISCFQNKKQLPSGELVAPDDLKEEYDIAEERHGETIPGVMLASKIPGYDDAYYLKQYAHYLNTYNDVSFVQMRGFADVSILTLVKCILSDFGKDGHQTSLDLGNLNKEKLTIITDDGVLKAKLNTEFGDQISVIGYEDC